MLSTTKSIVYSNQLPYIICRTLERVSSFLTAHQHIKGHSVP